MTDVNCAVENESAVILGDACVWRIGLSFGWCTTPGRSAA